MSISKKKNKCRLCGKKNLKLAFKFRNTPIGDDYKKRITKKVGSYPLKLVMCNSCKFVQLSNVVSPKKVYGEYLYITKTSLGLVKHFENLFNFLKKSKIFNQKSKVLEIGSNDGSLLILFYKYGCKVLGIDPAKSINAKQKLNLITDFFSFKASKKIKKKYGQYNLIIANNVIANIDNLDDLFMGVQNILSDKGFFVMETFSLKGLVEKNLIDNVYHEHLSYFTIEPFVKFLKKYELNIHYVEHLNVKGGSIRFIFQKGQKQEQKQKLLKIKNAINLEKKLHLNKLNSFKRLEKFNIENKIKITSLLSKIKKQKKTVYGYGASVGTTTLMYYYGINNKMDYLIDDEKKRHNLFSPGYNIQIKDPGFIKQKKPDYIFFFAWRYYKQILKRHKNFFKGIVKIVPLSKLKKFK